MSGAARKLDVVPERAPTKRWDWRKYGTLADPVHKSHISTLIGEFACTKQFRFDRERELAGDERETCSGKTEMGTAVHETIARALRNPELRQQLLAGHAAVSPDGVRRVLLEEFARATEGREVIWYGKAEYESVLADMVAMVCGLFQDLHRHVAAVELVEAGFICQLGPYYVEGHTDLVFRPRGLAPTALAFTDWKTGASKPHQIELDHGYESGFYSLALERGLFLPTSVVSEWRRLAQDERQGMPLDIWDVRALAAARSTREAMHVALRGVARRAQEGDDLPEGVVRFGQFPDVIRLTHLADYVPYQKKGKKKVERPEEVEHWSRVLGRDVQAGDQIEYQKDQWRGPAWYHVRRTADDVPRLESLLRALVGWVRFGRFVESVGEKCTRCSYRASCLTSGYEKRGDEAKQLASALKGLDLDEFGLSAEV